MQFVSNIIEPHAHHAVKFQARIDLPLNNLYVNI